MLAQASILSVQDHMYPLQPQINLCSQNDKHNIDIVLHHFLLSLASINCWPSTAKYNIWVLEALSQANIEASGLGHKTTDPLKNVMSDISTPLQYVFISLLRLQDHAFRISLVIADEEPGPQPAPSVRNALGGRTGLDYSGS